METAHRSTGRRVWIIVVLGGLLVLSCGDGGKGGPDGDSQPPTGWFTCTYTRGEALGVNACRAGRQLYAHAVAMDWWTDMSEDVDSVVFRVPSYEALWTQSLRLHLTA
jgi:hypothetical protein